MGFISKGQDVKVFATPPVGCQADETKICHANNGINGWVVNCPDTSGVESGHAGINHQEGRDILPPVSWQCVDVASHYDYTDKVVDVEGHWGDIQPNWCPGSPAPFVCQQGGTGGGKWHQHWIATTYKCPDDYTEHSGSCRKWIPNTFKTCTFAGQNWDTEGQAIYNNGCAEVVLTSTPTTTPTATPTPTTPTACGVDFWTCEQCHNLPPDDACYKRFVESCGEEYNCKWEEPNGLVKVNGKSNWVCEKACETTPEPTKAVDTCTSNCGWSPSFPHDEGISINECHGDVPKAPILAFTRLSPTSVRFNWWPMDNIDHFSLIYGYKSENEMGVAYIPGNATEITVNGLQANTYIYARLWAEQSNYCGNWSLVVDP